MLNYHIIIQARMGSTRRPGKINYLFNDEPMLMYQIRRLQSNGLKNIVVATSTEKSDDIVEQMVTEMGVTCFRGSEDDVLKRFYDCANMYQMGVIIRVGGDDPLIDPYGIQSLYEYYQKNNENAFVYSSHPQGWIYGTAAELFTFESLKQAHIEAKETSEREHIVPYYKKNKIKTDSIVPSKKYQRDDIYLSVDYQEDLDLIEQIIDYFTKVKKRYTFTQKELIELYDSGTLKINNKHLHSGF